MMKLLGPILLLLAGLGVGGGAAYGVTTLIGPKAATKAPEADPKFVPGGKLPVPLVFGDGKLAGYVQVEFQLEVGEDKVDFVAARLPLLLHAINMRTYRAPLASGPDGMLPDVEAFRKVVEAAAPEAFGAGVVRHVAITQATPA